MLVLKGWTERVAEYRKTGRKGCARERETREAREIERDRGEIRTEEKRLEDTRGREADRER